MKLQIYKKSQMDPSNLKNHRNGRLNQRNRLVTQNKTASENVDSRWFIYEHMAAWIIYAYSFW